MRQIHHHRGHYRRRALRPPVKFWLLIAAIAGLCALTIFLLMRPAGNPQDGLRAIWRGAMAMAGKPLHQTPLARKARIFPYSIVAGGVHSKQQFEEAMRSDPVAAAHYADFNAARFHMVKLQRAEREYVSFRVGDNVYWTSHKVRLRKGEMLISDGRHLGRARCGNRVSETPRLPTYNHEPSEKELNTVEQPAVETEAFTANSPLALAPFTLPGAASMPNHPLMPGPRRLASTTPPGYIPFTGVPSYLPPPQDCSKGTVESDGKCVTPNTPVTPVAPTPENNAWILFLTGGAALAAYAWIQRRRRESA